jgi:IclR family acetate operon transcriptional repressor
LTVLQLFRHGPAELGITEIARESGLSLSTAHRIVKALCNEQFMEQDRVSERYRLGAALLVLGQRALDHSGYPAALPLLEQLAETTGESTSLGIRRGNEVLVVLAAASRQRLRFDHPTGAGIGLHASAMGKALLAFSATGIAGAIAGLPDLERYTANTIGSKDALAAELERVQELGYAVNHEERYDGVTGVAAPVLARSGSAAAAVGLQGPSTRLSASGIESLGASVRATADDIARKLAID